MVSCGIYECYYSPKPAQERTKNNFYSPKPALARTRNNFYFGCLKFLFSVWPNFTKSFWINIPRFKNSLNANRPIYQYIFISLLLPFLIFQTRH